jgi:Spy/CpxP family protein refolding chaperone
MEAASTLAQTSAASIYETASGNKEVKSMSSDKIVHIIKTLCALASFASLLLCSFVLTARAQEVNRQPAPQQQQQESDAQESTPAQTTEKRAGGLLASLNLSPEQREQIRAIREQTERESKPLLMRLRQARRALDAAIYSDDAQESVIEARLGEFTSAQAGVARLRAFTELRVRRVLTPEQFDTLRELRRQALLQQREMRRNAAADGGARPGLREEMRRRRLQRRLGAPAPDERAAPNPSSLPRERRGVEFRRRPRT